MLRRRGWCEHAGRSVIHGTDAAAGVAPPPRRRRNAPVASPAGRTASRCARRTFRRGGAARGGGVVRAVDREDHTDAGGAEGSDLFDGYLEPDRSHAQAFDEMFHADGRVRSAYRALHSAIAPTAATDLAVRSEALDRAYLDQGITFSLSGQERPFPLSGRWPRLRRRATAQGHLLRRRGGGARRDRGHDQARLSELRRPCAPAAGRAGTSR
jgi:hypothetical protein